MQTAQLRVSETEPQLVSRIPQANLHSPETSQALIPEATKRPLSVNATTTASPSAEVIAASLASMPVAWLKALHQAALQLNGRQVIRLLEAMPSEQTSIAQHLMSLAEAYEYIAIAEKVAGLLEKRGE